jgi:MoaA/NifB/PqqE/SkfB family radical SAM enzyme
VPIMEFANKNKFTHVRFVTDILDQTVTTNIINKIQETFKEYNIDDSIAIYQPRNNFVHGIQDCLISLLKPMIYSDGNIYPCCGAQYAIKEETRRMPDKMIMGHYSELPEIIKNQKNFDGSICDVCYYSGYNKALMELSVDMCHLEFV